MVSKLDLSSFGHLKPAVMKLLNLGKFSTANYNKSGVFQTFNSLLLGVSLICFFIVIGSSYFYMFPAVEPVVENIGNVNANSYSNKSRDFLSNSCNIFYGKWVVDENYPLYNASQCPFAERGFNCLANGRRDKGYLKWRWSPKNCDIPRFEVNVIREMLRGKRIVFVGDSLSRTQWESMICMLMIGVDPKSVYEINGNQITKQIRYLGVRFRSFNFTVEFYRTVFLVQPGPVPRRAPKRVKSVLKLDQLDDLSNEWINSDILIFNSGHWWTTTKLFDVGCYFQIGGRMKLGMSINNAYKTALATWRSWAESAINPKRTRVFFRTFESTHWSSGARQNCKVTKQPLSKISGRQKSSISDAIIDAVKNISIPVTLLHVTPMSAFRSDAHVGTWSDNPSIPDCSHWCLPGVPDMWNELLFSFLHSN